MAEITAKIGKDANTDKKATINLDMPEDLNGLVAKYGAEAVAGSARASFIITIQAAMRRLLEAGKTQAEIQGQLASWTPELRIAGPKATPFERVTSALGKLTVEERKALLKQLREQGA